MKQWLVGYKRSFIRIYFVNDPDYGYRCFYILLALNFALIGLCLYFINS